MDEHGHSPRIRLQLPYFPVPLIQPSREVRHRLGWTLKTARVIHPKRDDLERATYIMSIRPFTRDQMVFGDESAVAERALTRRYARAPRGKRADRRGVMVRGERYSLLPIVGLTGVIVCHVKRGSFSHTSILRFFEEDVMSPFPLSRTTL